MNAIRQLVAALRGVDRVRLGRLERARRLYRVRVARERAQVRAWQRVHAQAMRDLAAWKLEEIPARQEVSL